MRIAVVSDQEAHGGAGIAAARLSAGLAEAGHEIHCVTARPSIQRHPWKTWHLRLRSREEAFWLLFGRIPGCAVVGRRLRHRRLDGEFRNLLRAIQPHVVNLHNLHWSDWPVSFLSVSSQVAPAIWTLHDMWSFTGGCTHAFAETAFATGCSEACQCWKHHGGTASRDAAGQWNARARSLSQTMAPVALCPSGWLASQASKSMWKQHRIETIANGLCLKTYEPMPRDFARRALGLSLEGLTVLGCGVSLDDPKKGAEAFHAALLAAREEKISLLTLGSAPPSNLPPHIQARHLGYQTSERMQALAYNAADLVLFPTLADNLPNVLVESIACGTPAVSTPVGGVPEIIQEGVSGWIASSATSAGVAECLQRALQDLRRGVDFRSSCRALAVKNFDLPLQTARYARLFEACVALRESTPPSVNPHQKKHG